jgi:hypothetical protein
MVFYTHLKIPGDEWGTLFAAQIGEFTPKLLITKLGNKK